MPGLADSPRCPCCGGPLRCRWQPCTNGTRHLRATCPACGHRRFLPQHNLAAVELADAAGPGESYGSLFWGGGGA
jgi:hypothetical protein